MADLQNNFDTLLKSLVGDTIIGVHYYLYPNTVYDQYQEPLHHINDGIDLEMGSGRVIGISWDRQFVDFNLSIIDKSLASNLLNPKITRVDMTQHRNWYPFVNKSIQQAQMYWRGVVTKSGQDSDDMSKATPQSYPQDMGFVFDGGSHLYISASMYLPECKCFLSAMDSVSIFFDDDTARQCLPSFIDDDQPKT